jgi:hypothetical protein
MNTTLQTPPDSKSLHKTARLINLLLSLALSWAALDHLMTPKDLAYTVRKYAATLSAILKPTTLCPLFKNTGTDQSPKVEVSVALQPNQEPAARSRHGALRFFAPLFSKKSGRETLNLT